MPALFDSNDAKGIEAQALYDLASRLSECTQFIELSESDDAVEARTKITIGPVPEPFDSEEYNIEELENEFFFCTIAPDDQESYATGVPDTIAECPQESGRFEIYIRRQVRKSELGVTNGKADVYLYFLDRVSAIGQQLHRLANTNNQPKVNSVSRMFGPSFADFASEVAQGMYLWTVLLVDWGDDIS